MALTQEKVAFHKALKFAKMFLALYRASPTNMPISTLKGGLQGRSDFRSALI